VIPPWAALIAWIIVSIVLMMDRNNARGFTLAFLGALMFLPAAYEIKLPGAPDIEKDNVASIGVLLGTILFHPRLFDRFKLHPIDFVFLLIIQARFITSFMNDFGMYDGFSRSVGFVLNFMLPVFLARVHLGTPRSMRTFLLGLIGAAVIYVPLAMWAFRMSPQIHTTVYGYFQHVFQQHARGGFWRPIVFLEHALLLGRFFAFAAFLAMFPMRKDLENLFGRVGSFIFLAPLLGLTLQMSLGPIFLFVLLCGGYLVIRQHVWIGYVMPGIAFAWLISVFAGSQLLYGTVDQFEVITPARAQSLEYRLIALQEYRGIILDQPVFGHGGWGHGRIEGRATDSEALIRLLDSGFVGASFYFLWWFLMMYCAYQAMRWTNGTVFSSRAAAVGLLTSLGLCVCVIDAALDQHLVLLAGGMFAIYQWLQTRPELPALPAQQHNAHGAALRPRQAG